MSGDARAARVARLTSDGIDRRSGRALGDGVRRRRRARRRRRSSRSRRASSAVEHAGAVALRVGGAGGQRLAQALRQLELLEARAHEAGEEGVARTDGADDALERRDVARERRAAGGRTWKRATQPCGVLMMTLRAPISQMMAVASTMSWSSWNSWPTRSSASRTLGDHEVRAALHARGAAVRRRCRARRSSDAGARAA